MHRDRHHATKRLFLVAREGVRNRLAGVAEALLDGAEDTLTLLLGIVAARAGGVTELLCGGLLALCLSSQ